MEQCQFCSAQATVKIIFKGLGKYAGFVCHFLLCDSCQWEWSA